MILKFCYSTSRFPTWISLRRGQWSSCLGVCAIRGKQFLWSRIKPACSKEQRMSLWGWTRGKLPAARRSFLRRNFQGAENEPIPLHHRNEPGEGCSPGVAFERRHQLHAVFCPVGGSRIQ